MLKKKIYVFLFDGYSDWEIAFLTPEIKKSEDFELIYFSIDGKGVRSMGGLHVIPDISLDEISMNDIEMLILPGGSAWEKGGNQGVEHLVKRQFIVGKSIAAICAATTYLGQLGILDQVKHTSNDLDYLKAMVPEYKGEHLYTQSLAQAYNNVITANGVGPIEFAKEIFLKIGLYNDQDAEKWYQLFKNAIWSH